MPKIDEKNKNRRKEEETDEDYEGEEEEEDEEESQEKDDNKEQEKKYNVNLEAKELVINNIGGVPFCFNVLTINKGDKRYAVVEVNQKWLKDLENDKLKRFFKEKYKKMLEEDVDFQQQIVHELTKQFIDIGITSDNVMCVKKFDGLFASSWEKDYNNESNEDYSRIANEMFEVIDKAKTTEQSVFNEYSLAGLHKKILKDSQAFQKFEYFHNHYKNKNNYYTGIRRKFRGLVYNKPYVVGKVKDKKSKSKNVIIFEPHFFDDFDQDVQKQQLFYKTLLKVKVRQQDLTADFKIYEANNWQSFYFPGQNVKDISKVAKDINQLPKEQKKIIKSKEQKVENNIQQIIKKFTKKINNAGSQHTKNKNIEIN